MVVKRKLLCALGVLMFAVSFSNGTGFASTTSDTSSEKGIVTPQAYTEQVINYVKTKQSKTWATDWEDYAYSEKTYKELRFRNGYTLDSITTTYSDSTCNIISGCTRYKYEQYNYSTY
ncbi:hypothetical protein D3C74_227420 [compost metagenome]